jgi:hypothetical protein
MNQYKAVKKMILTIKLEEVIPEECIPIIEMYLRQMYAVGYDEGRCLNNYKRKQILQYDETGKFINSFDSRIEAARKTGFPLTSIWRSVSEDRPVRGYKWKYI